MTHFQNIFVGLQRHVRSFVIQERGAVSVEAAILLPLLITLFILAFSYFDAYRREVVLAKAGFTISDLLSRETGTVSPRYLEGLLDVFEYITFSEGEDLTWIRVTELQKDDGDLEIQFSYATGSNDALTDSTLLAFVSQIPPLVDNERLVVVESYATYTPYLTFGLPPRRAATFAVTRQRDGQAVKWDETILPDAPTTGSTPVLVSG